MDIEIIGEALRQLANTYSDGHYGQGQMKQRQGESKEDYRQRLAFGLGAAVDAFHEGVKLNFKGFQNGIYMNQITKWSGIVGVGGLLVIGAIAIFKPKKSKRRRR